MLQWIADNKQWLFSGIGVTVILGVFYLVRRVYSRKNTESDCSHPTSSGTAATSAAPTCYNLDMVAIIQEIESRPPYQRKEARQNYIGLRFEFTGQLYSAESRDKGEIHFCLHKSSGEYPLVIGNVAEKDCPELKVVHQGTKVTVQGILANFDAHTVDIDNVVITNLGGGNRGQP